MVEPHGEFHEKCVKTMGKKTKISRFYVGFIRIKTLIISKYELALKEVAST